MGMVQQTANEKVDGTIVVMHITVTYIDENLAVNEIDVIAQAYRAQPLAVALPETEAQVAAGLGMS